MMTLALFPVCPECGGDNLHPSATLVDCSSADVFHPPHALCYMCEGCEAEFHADDMALEERPHEFEFGMLDYARSLGICAPGCAICGNPGSYRWDGGHRCRRHYPGEIIRPDGTPVHDGLEPVFRE